MFFILLDVHSLAKRALFCLPQQQDNSLSASVGTRQIAAEQRQQDRLSDTALDQPNCKLQLLLVKHENEAFLTLDL